MPTSLRDLLIDDSFYRSLYKKFNECYLEVFPSTLTKMVACQNLPAVYICQLAIINYDQGFRVKVDTHQLHYGIS